MLGESALDLGMRDREDARYQVVEPFKFCGCRVGFHASMITQGERIDTQMGDESSIEKEREIIAKLLETVEALLVRSAVQRSLLEDLIGGGVLNECLGELEARLTPIAHLRLEPLVDVVLARPHQDIEIPDWDEIALSLVESANEIQIQNSKDEDFES